MCLGIPGLIVEITDARRKLGMVDVSGVRREVNLACIAPEGEPLESLLDSWALIHVGFAMSRINEEQAAETLEILTMLGEAQEEIRAMQRSQDELEGTV